MDDTVFICKFPSNALDILFAINFPSWISSEVVLLLQASSFSFIVDKVCLRSCTSFNKARTTEPSSLVLVFWTGRNRLSTLGEEVIGVLGSVLDKKGMPEAKIGSSGLETT